MPKFGKKSKELRQYLCKDLKRLVDEVIKEYDFSIVETVRDRTAQENAFELKVSRAHYGESAHNYHPAFAFDFTPYPCPRKQDRGIVVIDSDSPEWEKAINIFKKIAKSLKIRITCGADWTFKDKMHIELSDWRDRVSKI